jgi:hypothetical protein
VKELKIITLENMHGNEKKNMDDLFYIQKILSFFMRSIPSGIFPSNCHLLTLNGHGSHVALKAIKLAQQCGLDMTCNPFNL